MGTLLLGFGLIAAILGVSVGPKLTHYIEPSSLALVILGTFAILLASTPSNVLRSLWKSLRGLFQPIDHVGTYTDIIAKLAQSRTAGVKTNQPLIRYAIDLWNQGVDPELFAAMLSQKRKDMESERLDGIQALKNLVKYPPSLGMAGTVMGMVRLFSTLDENKNGIGVNLSIAMTSTFLGLVLTNLLIAPLADRLHVRQVNQERLCETLFEALLLINRGEPPTLIQDHLNGNAS